ncbi:MAG: carboxypeptidase-like regulatory domain-containing protein [Verrucomicrobiota bacterium]|nr:carboxypeptidase-like regulatory domain-containing protein [Verrucomicrobiota bacterium]
MKTFTFGLVFLWCVGLSAAFAQKSTIEGQLLDASNRPLKNAQIQVQSEKGKPVATLYGRTDAKGHFAIADVPAGRYSVSALASGKVVTSTPHVRTGASAVVQVKLGGKPAATASAAPAKKMRWVWVPPQTGSHIIGGGWVQVPETGTDNDSGLGSQAKEQFTHIQQTGGRSPMGNGGQ